MTLLFTRNRVEEPRAKYRVKNNKLAFDDKGKNLIFCTHRKILVGDVFTEYELTEEVAILKRAECTVIPVE